MEQWIHGLKTVNVELENLYYIFTDELLENGFLIERSYYGEEIHEEFHVHQLTKDDAVTFTIYSGVALDAIQAYRILRDVVDLSKQFGIVRFPEVLESFSSSFISSSMQTDDNNRKDVREQIKLHFENVHDFLRNQ